MNLRRTGAFAGPGLVFLALVGLHAPLLRLPYYWDEAGYFIPTALDFFRHGWLIPRTTLANGHPPLLSVYLAAWWGLFGFHPAVTRVAMVAVAAAAVWGVLRLGEAWCDLRTGIVAAALFALSPLFFAQSSLAQLDVAVTAAVIWGLVFRQRKAWWAAAVCFTLACLTKETAAIVPATLLAVDLWKRRPRWSLLLPLGALGLWFVYYHHVTGYWFGNPEFFAYNVGQAALSPARIALSLGHRVWQLAGYNGLWLLTALALARRRRLRLGMPAQWWALILAYLVFHAAVGGAVLARYLLPASALFFLWLGRQLLLWPRGYAVAAGCAAFLVVNWFWNPPYPFPYEDNLAYAGFVELHQAAAAELARLAPTSAVWTAWPATDELHNPDLGYVAHPIAERELSDFTQAALERATAPQWIYLYSREYEPGADLSAAVPGWRAVTDRIFHHAPAVGVAEWEQRFGARPIYEISKAGQWVVILAGRP